MSLTNELTPGRLERIRQNHSAGDHYAELGQADIGLLLEEIDAAYNRGFAEGSGNEGAYQRDLARLRACWAEALENVAARNQEIEQLKLENQRLQALFDGAFT
jgi:hypothetical protein